MTLQAPGDRAQDSNPGIVKSPLDVGGGLFLIGVAILGFMGAFSLPFGHLSGIGSGLLPKSVAVLVATFGVLLLAQGLVFGGDRLDRWGIRGIVFVLGSVLVFAFTIRQLGLVAAGPLTFLVASLADRETRPVEVVIFAIIGTLACGLLFKELLGLPIPFDPLSLAGPLHAPYEAAKATLKALFLGRVH